MMDQVLVLMMVLVYVLRMVQELVTTMDLV